MMGGPGSGRPRKPHGLHVIEGTERSRHKEWNEPEVPDPDELDLEAPDWLCAQAREIWNQDIEFLMNLGIIKKTDLRAFALYVSEWDEWFKAREMERRRGKYTVNGNGSTVLSPWSRRKTEAAANILRFQLQFGLTPASRSRVDAEVPEKRKNRNLNS